MSFVGAVEMVRDQEFLTVEMLAEQFQVTTQTIRRDLNMVCDRGLARRRHGGIEYPRLGSILRLQTDSFI